MTKEDFTRLAEKHLFILEGSTLDKEGNKILQICGVDELFNQLFIKDFSQQIELLIAELIKVKSMTEHLTAEERNEYFGLALNNLVFRSEGEKDEHIVTLELNKPVTSKISEWKENSQVELSDMTLEQAISKAKANLDKIKDVDKHLDDIR